MKRMSALLLAAVLASGGALAADAIKKDRELRKGSWFFGGVRI